MLVDIIKKLGQNLNKQSPILLTAVAATGVVATAALTAKASFSASDIIREEVAKNGEIDEVKEKVKAYAPLVWKLYIPAGICGGLTIASLVMSNKIGSSRTAAAVGAYSITEKAFGEYRAKVVEEIGKHKEQVIRDDIARDKVVSDTMKDSLIITGTGEVLCCELHTRRYFMSDMETLRRAQNDINMSILSDLYVTLETFYSLLSIPPTSHSSELGWDSEKLLELEFSTVLTDDGRPCLAFNYNYIKPI